MKTLIVCLALSLSCYSHARQYVQCSYQTTFDSLVLNLNDNQPTLYLTNGVHLPDEDRISILKNVELVSEDANTLIYESNDDSTRERIYFPKQQLGRASQYFTVELELENFENREFSRRSFSCFSSIYAD